MKDSYYANIIYMFTKLNLFVLVKNILLPNISNSKHKQALASLISKFSLNGDRELAAKTRDIFFKGDTKTLMNDVLTVYSTIRGKEIVVNDTDIAVIERNLYKNDEHSYKFLLFLFMFFSLYIPVGIATTYIYAMAKRYDMLSKSELLKFKELTKEILVDYVKRYISDLSEQKLNSELLGNVKAELLILTDHILARMDIIAEETEHVSSLNSYDSFKKFLNQFS